MCLTYYIEGIAASGRRIKVYLYVQNHDFFWGLAKILSPPPIRVKYRNYFTIVFFWKWWNTFLFFEINIYSHFIKDPNKKLRIGFFWSKYQHSSLLLKDGIIGDKFCLRETLNMLTDADRRTDIIIYIYFIFCLEVSLKCHWSVIEVQTVNSQQP